MVHIGFGAFYNDECGVSPGEFARRLEDLGFDAFFTGESPTMRGPSLDQFTVLNFAAAATSTLKVGADVLLMPLHHPAWVAKQYGTLDVLSNGRTILGVGVGGDGAGAGPKQFAGFGIPLSERGKRTDEGIEIVKSLWTEAESSYHGRFFNFDGVTMDPKPVQKPHPPIWIGGRPGGTETGPDGQLRKKSATGAIRRAATYGDTWHPFYMTPEMYRESVQDIRDHAALIGRDISHMGWSLNTHWLIAPSHEEALDRATAKLRYGHAHARERIARYDLLGTPEDCMRRLQDFIDAGVRYVVCQWSCEPQETLQHIEWIGKEVIPHYR